MAVAGRSSQAQAMTYATTPYASAFPQPARRDAGQRRPSAQVVPVDTAASLSPAASLAAMALTAHTSVWDGPPRRSRILPVIVIAALTGGLITAMNYRTHHSSAQSSGPQATVSTPLPGSPTIAPAATPDGGTASTPSSARTTASRLTMPEAPTIATAPANAAIKSLGIAAAKPAPSAKLAGDAVVKKARPEASQVNSLPSNTPSVAEQPVNSPTPMPAPVTMPAPSTTTTPMTTPTPTPMAVMPAPSPATPAVTPAVAPDKADQPAG